MDDAARIADRLIVFHEGGIAMDGTPDEVFSRARELTEMGLDVPQPAAIAAALRERGAAPVSYTHLDVYKRQVGEGTSYADLTYTISLNSEEYGVGFRKGSDLASALNDFFAASWADGTMQTLADTYGVTAALIPQE